MTIQYEGVYAGEFLLSEGNGEISREVVTISTGGTNLTAGTILKESSGTFSAWGSGDTAKAVLFANVKDGESQALVIRRFAEVDGKKLVFPAGATGYEAGLSAEGIVVRDGGVAFAPDRTAPTFSSAEIANSAKKNIVITFSENLATNSVPAKSAFEVKKGSTTQAISAIAVSGATVTLSFTADFENTDSVTVAYTKPAAKALQDLSGNLVESFAAKTITNNVQ